MKLVKFADDWADEMDILDWAIYTDSAWEMMVENAPKIKKGITLGFGTNEYNEYRDGEDMLRKVTAVDITADEAAVINKFFTQYQHGRVIDHIHDIIYENAPDGLFDDDYSPEPSEEG